MLRRLAQMVDVPEHDPFGRSMVELRNEAYLRQENRIAYELESEAPLEGHPAFSQLAGFTKRDDLRFFTKAIFKIDTVHDGACLLCSEETHLHCHRRLVTEYIQEKWDGVEIEHLP